MCVVHIDSSSEFILGYHPIDGESQEGFAKIRSEHADTIRRKRPNRGKGKDHMPFVKQKSQANRRSNNQLVIRFSVKTLIRQQKEIIDKLS